MTKEDQTYVCIYDEKDSFGFSIGKNSSFPSKQTDDAASILDIKKKFRAQGQSEDSAFAEHFTDFTESMLGYIDFLPMIAGFGPLMSVEMGKKVFSRFLGENGTLFKKRARSKIFKIPSAKIPDLLKLRDDLKSSYSTGKQVPRMLLIGIVSSYENHMAQFARDIMRANPGAVFGKEKTVTYKELIEGVDLEDLKNSILDKEVDDVFRESFDKQIKWFEKFIPADNISRDYARWKDLIEIFERRNIFTHNNGVVNSQYMASGLRHSFLDPKKVKIGDQLEADPPYFIGSLETIVEFGTELIQVAWRKLDKDEEELADSILSDFGFELIVRGRYALAARIIKFALTLRGKRSEARKRVLTINLANAHALQGDWDRAEEILNQEDWSAVSADFACCLASLRKDVDTVVKEMRRIGSEGEIRPIDYQQWPVFFHVREDERFKQEFERLFELPYLPSPKQRGGLVASFLGARLEVKDNKDSPQNSSETVH